MKSNVEYWKERFELLEKSQHAKAIDCYENIENHYRRAQKEVEKQISTWYQRFAKNNGITMAEAKRALNAKELKELRWDVNEYIKHGKSDNLSEEWIKKLENASARHHISRLEALKLQLQQTTEVLFGNQLDDIDRTVRDVYKSGYLHTAFEIQKGIGVGWDIASLDDRKISKIINNPWAADGRNFSERIWNNSQKLIEEMNKTITQNIILGQDPQKAIDKIAKRLNVSNANAGRLVMTEEAFFSSTSQKDCFEDLDVEQFEIVATLDSRTSEICQDMDGQHFKMSDWEVGVTAPPFHVNCRSTTVPYFDDEFDAVGERAARGEDGKNYFVPGNMTYKEWKKSFVDSNTEARDRLRLITNNNKSNPRYYDFKGKDLKTVEQEIICNDYETAVIFDNGKAISCQIGNEDTVIFTRHQLRLFEGKDITHNHPLSTPPSPEDLYLLVDYKAKSFRTCGKNGTYVLEYNENIQQLPTSDKFSDDYNKLLYQLRPKIIEQYYNGHNEQEVLVKLGEEIWNELYKLYGVKPRFERR